MDDSLQRRGQALEDLFFQQRDRLLLDRMRRELADKQARDSLAHVSGISNEKVLQSLVDQGIAAGTVVCLTMVPLVAVAWADGEVQSGERAAILQAAADNGIKPVSAAYDLLDTWLNTKPGPELLDAWKLYTTSLRCTLDAASYQQVATSIVARASGIAESAGGILGLGSISASEKRLIEDLSKVLGL